MAITTPLLHKSIQNLDPVTVFQCIQPGSGPGGRIVTLLLQTKAQLMAQSVPGGLVLSLDCQPLPQKSLAAKHLHIMQLWAIVVSRVSNQ